MNVTVMSRRDAIKPTGAATMGAIIAPNLFAVENAPEPDGSRGYVIGQPVAQQVGLRVLADGGNAIDAIVAAALTDAIVDPLNTGIGGYGMCATVVTRDGKAVLAAGGAGGRMIPNALLEVLTAFVALGKPMPEAIAALRFYTEGDASLGFEKDWPAADFEPLKKIGYAVRTQPSASIGAVALDAGGLSQARR